MALTIRTLNKKAIKSLVLIKKDVVKIKTSSKAIEYALEKYYDHIEYIKELEDSVKKLTFLNSEKNEKILKSLDKALIVFNKKYDVYKDSRFEDLALIIDENKKGINK